jgi:hypothetical protein
MSAVRSAPPSTPPTTPPMSTDLLVLLPFVATAEPVGDGAELSVVLGDVSYLHSRQHMAVRVADGE